MNLKRLLPVTALALALTLALSGCGRTTQDTQPTATPEGETAAPEEPPYWEDWTDPFAQEEAQALETRAVAFWEKSLDQPTRYKEVSGLQGYYLAPDQWSSAEELVRILQFTESLDRAALEEGTAGICRVDFTAWYQPETYYLGPQYGDGNLYVYLLVYAHETKDPQYLSAWYVQDAQTQRPADPKAAELGLNGYQYDILLHQCRALAAAGITGADPAQWTAGELARYLVVRGRDFDREPEEWAAGKGDSLAGMILAIDFTGDNEWSNMPAPDLLEKITQEDWEEALTALETEEGSWTYLEGKDQVTAVLEGKGEYTFSLCPGFAEWNSRTFCTGIKAL